MEMQIKWDKKKESGDFTADGSMKLDPIDRQAEEIRRSRADGSDQLSRQIDLKLNSGQKLTAEEMEYLRQHDPQTYQKVRTIEAEQKNYENELKKCKTKEEVERVKMMHTANSLNAVNSIMNNPVIPEEKKLELVMNEHRKNQALQETTKEFIESGEYAKLPTEAERLKAEKDLKEAKEAELGIEDPAKKAEEKKTEATQAKDSAVDGGASGEEGSSTAQSMPGKDVKEAEDTVMADRRRLTRMEAETTPEALKVKRAKARAAYKGTQVEAPMQIVDVKVE